MCLLYTTTEESECQADSICAEVSEKEKDEMLSSCAQFCIYFLDFHTEKNEGDTEPTLGIKPQYVTEVFVDKENADMALHIIHTLS